jgi:ABC-type amino acid transport substrate-binding protein
MFVSKNHPKRDEILSLFNKGMRILKQSGKHEKLLNQALGLE